MIIIINALVDNIIVISCVACSSGLLVMIYTGSIPVTSTLIHGSACCLTLCGSRRESPARR